MALSIFFFIIVFIVGIQTVLPYLVKRSIVFGVTIPERFIHDSKLKMFKKQYSVLVGGISFLILVGYLIWAFVSSPSEMQIVIIGSMIEFGILILSSSLYFYFHSKTIQLKKEKKWLESLKQVKVTDLSVRQLDEMLPWYFYLLPILITVGLMGYTILNYDILPDQIPTHWGPSGEPDAFTEKNYFTAIQLSLFLLILQFMFLGIQIATKKSGIKLSATGFAASKNRQLSLRKYSSWFLYFVVLLVTMLMSYFQLTTIHPQILDGISKVAIPIGFLILILIGTLILSIKVGRSDKNLDEVVNYQITDLDEDQYWKGGIFYFNKNDPSIFVEKRFGVGWTINFANPIGYFIVFVPIVVILVISFL